MFRVWGFDHCVQRDLTIEHKNYIQRINKIPCVTIYPPCKLVLTVIFRKTKIWSLSVVRFESMSAPYSTLGLFYFFSALHYFSFRRQFLFVPLYILTPRILDSSNAPTQNTEKLKKYISIMLNGHNTKYKELVKTALPSQYS